MIDNNCAYCVEGDLVAKFGIKICELETSKVYLFKEQSHPGRCIVAHKKHVGDMNELTAEERAAYFEDVARVARAIMAAFHPDKVNYIPASRHARNKPVNRLKIGIININYRILCIYI